MIAQGSIQLILGRFIPLWREGVCKWGKWDETENAESKMLNCRGKRHCIQLCSIFKETTKLGKENWSILLIYIYVCIHVCAKKNVHGKEFKVLKFTGSILSTETVLNIVANLGNLESLKLQILTSDCKNIQSISGHSADVTCLHVSFSGM